MSDELLTVRDDADLLKLNQQTVRNMVDRGEISAARVGSRRVRIRQSELDRFLEAGSHARRRPRPRLTRVLFIAWATFGASMAEATSVLESPAQLAVALDRLSEAAEALARTLRNQA